MGGGHIPQPNIRAICLKNLGDLPENSGIKGQKFGQRKEERKGRGRKKREKRGEKGKTTFKKSFIHSKILNSVKAGKY